MVVSTCVLGAGAGAGRLWPLDQPAGRAWQEGGVGGLPRDSTGRLLRCEVAGQGGVGGAVWDGEGCAALWTRRGALYWLDLPGNRWVGAGAVPGPVLCAELCKPGQLLVGLQGRALQVGLLQAGRVVGRLPLPGAAVTAVGSRYPLLSTVKHVLYSSAVRMALWCSPSVPPT